MEDNPHSSITQHISNRPSCSFGVRCYRQNPQHRSDVAHPGDTDFQFPALPNSTDNAPDCQYGKNCYRLNPKHFKDFKHPAETNVNLNYKNYIRIKNKRRVRVMANTNAFGIDDDFDDSGDDPFQTDSDDSDYIPIDDDGDF